MLKSSLFHLSYWLHVIDSNYNSYVPNKVIIILFLYTLNFVQAVLWLSEMLVPTTFSTTIQTADVALVWWLANTWAREEAASDVTLAGPGSHVPASAGTVGRCCLRYPAPTIWKGIVITAITTCVREGHWQHYHIKLNSSSTSFAIISTTASNSGKRTTVCMANMHSV